MMMKHAKLTRIQSLLLRSSPTIRSSIHSFNSVTEEDVFAANENHRYCRLHMAHCMRKLPSHDTGCLLTCVNDLKIVSMRVMSAQETSHGAENRRLVVSLMEPTIEYIMKCIFRNASEKQVGDVLVELGVGLNQKELLGRFPCVSIVLHHLLKQLPSEVVSSRAVEILHLIECSRDDSLDQCLNYRLLGFRLCEKSQMDTVNAVVDKIIEVIIEYDGLDDYLKVVDAFVDIVLQNHMDDHLSSILEGISKRACTKGIADDDLATLQSILVKLLSYCKDIEDIFSMNHFLKILDLMYGNSRSIVNIHILDMGIRKGCIRDLRTIQFLLEISQAVQWVCSGCAWWLCSVLMLSGCTPCLCSMVMVELFPLSPHAANKPRAPHSGHHDQNQRRASLTAVKRLAGLQTRRLTLCFKLWLLLHFRHGCCL